MSIKKLTTIVMFTLIATAITACAMDVPTPTGVAPISTETVSVGDREIVLQVSGPTTGPRYDRDSYDYPADRDGDCVNTRHEVLASQSTVEPDYSRDGCYVSTGEWTDPYSGDVYTNPRDLQIDHLVPLYNAHRSGAANWPAERRAEFANYAGNLIAVSSPLNQEKGSASPDEWRPPNSAYWCDYAARYATVKSDWGLTVTSEEIRAIREMAATCG